MKKPRKRGFVLGVAAGFEAPHENFVRQKRLGVVWRICISAWIWPKADTFWFGLDAVESRSEFAHEVIQFGKSSDLIEDFCQNLQGDRRGETAGFGIC